MGNVRCLTLWTALALFILLCHKDVLGMKEDLEENPSRERFKTISVLTEDGIELTGNLYEHGNPIVIIVAHGFFQNKDTNVFRQISESFLPDFDVLTINFRGHGTSEGRFTLTATEKVDLIKFLTLAHQSYDKVGLIGFSLGAAISIVVSAEGDLVDSLIVVSAPTAYSAIDFQFWRREALANLMHNLSPKAKGKGVKLGNPFLKKPKPIDHIAQLNDVPILFIHGTNDWLIRPHHSQELYKKANEPKELKLVDKGLHAEKIYDQYPTDFQRWTVDWFRKTLAS